MSDEDDYGPPPGGPPGLTMSGTGRFESEGDDDDSDFGGPPGGPPGGGPPEGGGTGKFDASAIARGPSGPPADPDASPPGMGKREGTHEPAAATTNQQQCPPSATTSDLGAGSSIRSDGGDRTPGGTAVAGAGAGASGAASGMNSGGASPFLWGMDRAQSFRMFAPGGMGMLGAASSSTLDALGMGGGMASTGMLMDTENSLSGTYGSMVLGASTSQGLFNPYGSAPKLPSTVIRSSISQLRSYLLNTGESVGTDDENRTGAGGDTKIDEKEKEDMVMEDLVLDEGHASNDDLFSDGGGASAAGGGGGGGGGFGGGFNGGMLNSMTSGIFSAPPPGGAGAFASSDSFSGMAGGLMSGVFDMQQQHQLPRQGSMVGRDTSSTMGGSTTNPPAFFFLAGADMITSGRGSTSGAAAAGALRSNSSFPGAATTTSSGDGASGDQSLSLESTMHTAEQSPGRRGSGSNSAEPPAHSMRNESPARPNDTNKQQQQKKDGGAGLNSFNSDDGFASNDSSPSSSILPKPAVAQPVPQQRNSPRRNSNSSNSIANVKGGSGLFGADVAWVTSAPATGRSAIGGGGGGSTSSGAVSPDVAAGNLVNPSVMRPNSAPRRRGSSASPPAAAPLQPPPPPSNSAGADDNNANEKPAEKENTARNTADEVSSPTRKVRPGSGNRGGNSAAAAALRGENITTGTRFVVLGKDGNAAVVGGANSSSSSKSKPASKSDSTAAHPDAASGSGSPAATAAGGGASASAAHDEKDSSSSSPAANNQDGRKLSLLSSSDSGSRSTPSAANHNNNNPNINSGTFLIRGPQVGAGGFAAVYVGLLSHEEQHRMVAIKEITFDADGVAPEDLRRVASEFELLRELRHPNVIRYVFFDYSMSKSMCRIVMEYVSAGSLQQITMSGRTLSEPVLRDFSQQLLEGLQFIHSHGITHMDVKPDNCLLNHDGTLKLADFGCSRSVNQLVESSKFVFGSPIYMAPEQIENEIVCASDIWSLGATMLQLATGKAPWHETNLVRNNLYLMFYITGHPDAIPAFPEGLGTPEFGDFLRKCFTRDASKRPTAKELLQHPWIVGGPGAAQQQLAHQEIEKAASLQPPTGTAALLNSLKVHGPEVEELVAIQTMIVSSGIQGYDVTPVVAAQAVAKAGQAAAAGGMDRRGSMSNVYGFVRSASMSQHGAANIPLVSGSEPPSPIARRASLSVADAVSVSSSTPAESPVLSGSGGPTPTGFTLDRTGGGASGSIAAVAAAGAAAAAAAGAGQRRSSNPSPIPSLPPSAASGGGSNAAPSFNNTNIKGGSGSIDPETAAVVDKIRTGGKLGSSLGNAAAGDSIDMLTTPTSQDGMISAAFSSSMEGDRIPNLSSSSAVMSGSGGGEMLPQAIQTQQQQQLQRQMSRRVSQAFPSMHGAAAFGIPDVSVAAAAADAQQQLVIELDDEIETAESEGAESPQDGGESPLNESGNIFTVQAGGLSTNSNSPMTGDLHKEGSSKTSGGGSSLSVGSGQQQQQQQQSTMQESTSSSSLVATATLSEFQPIGQGGVSAAARMQRSRSLFSAFGDFYPSPERASGGGGSPHGRSGLNSHENTPRAAGDFEKVTSGGSFTSEPNSGAPTPRRPADGSKKGFNASQSLDDRGDDSLTAFPSFSTGGGGGGGGSGGALKREKSMAGGQHPRLAGARKSIAVAVPIAPDAPPVMLHLQPEDLVETEASASSGFQQQQQQQQASSSGAFGNRDPFQSFDSVGFIGESPLTSPKGSVPSQSPVLSEATDTLAATGGGMGQRKKSLAAGGGGLSRRKSYAVCMTDNVKQQLANAMIERRKNAEQQQKEQLSNSSAPNSARGGIVSPNLTASSSASGCASSGAVHAAVAPAPPVKMVNALTSPNSNSGSDTFALESSSSKSTTPSGMVPASDSASSILHSDIAGLSKQQVRPSSGAATGAGGGGPSSGRRRSSNSPPPPVVRATPTSSRPSSGGSGSPCAGAAAAAVLEKKRSGLSWQSSHPDVEELVGSPGPGSKGTTSADAQVRPSSSGKK